MGFIYAFETFVWMLELKIINFTEIMRKKHDRNYFFLTQEWTLLVLARQVNMLELLFTTADVWVDECLWIKA